MMKKIMNRGATGVVDDEKALSEQLGYLSKSAKEYDVESDVDVRSTTDDDHPSSGTQHASDVNVIIAGKESRMVACSKIVVLLVIVVLACVIGVLTFGFVRKQETDNRNTQVRRAPRRFLFTFQPG